MEWILAARYMGSAVGIVAALTLWFWGLTSLLDVDDRRKFQHPRGRFRWFAPVYLILSIITGLYFFLAWVLSID